MLLQSHGFSAAKAFATVLAIGTLALPLSAFAAGPRVVVLPNTLGNGPDVASATSEVGNSLSTVAEVVPFGQFARLGRKAGVKKGKMATARAIKRVGKQLKLDFAVIFEGFVKVKRVGKKRRKRRRPYVRVALINVSSGKLLFTKTWSVGSNRLTGGEVRRVIDSLRPQIKKFAPVRVAKEKAKPKVNLPVLPAPVPPASRVAPTPVVEATPEPVAPRQEAPLPPPPEPEPAAPAVPAVSEVGAKVAPTPAADPWAVAKEPAAATDPWSDSSASTQHDDWSNSGDSAWGESKTPAPTGTAPTASQTANPERTWSQSPGESDAWGDADAGIVSTTREKAVDYGPAFRRAIRFTAGAAAVRREAAIPNPNVEGQSKMSYGLGGGLGSFSPGATGSLDVYPLRFAGVDGALGGMGLTVDFSFFPRSAYERDSTGNITSDPITSNVMNIRAGLLWDFPLWDDNSAPQIGGVAGFQYYTFPLESGAFPGVDYSGPYFGLNFQLPMSDAFQLTFGGDLTIPLMPGGGASALGDSGTGYGFGSTFSFVYSLLPATGVPIEFELGGRYDSYNCTFEGQTSLGGNVEVMENIELRDVSWVGFFALGFSL